MLIQEIVPYVAMCISILGLIGTLITVGQKYGKLEGRIEHLETTRDHHEASIISFVATRDRVIVLEQGHAHTKVSIDSLTVEVKGFRSDLKEALSEVRRDMQRLLENGENRR